MSTQQIIMFMSKSSKNLVGLVCSRTALLHYLFCDFRQEMNDLRNLNKKEVKNLSKQIEDAML